MRLLSAGYERAQQAREMKKPDESGLGANSSPYINRSIAGPPCQVTNHTDSHASVLRNSTIRHISNDLPPYLCMFGGFTRKKRQKLRIFLYCI